MPRIVFSLAALLLCSTALAGCQTVGNLSPLGGDGAASNRTALEKQIREAPPTDIASGVRQAHALRLAGKYDAASRILSQMMLVASDDPRVVGEYGKTLLQRGRANDAVQFLSRAVQLQADDWTTYSALGVAYDQLGNAASAKEAYERALTLAPREASVLSNYALSRMLASDLAGARVLAARAQTAGGGADPKIARNIAMIQAAAPKPAPVASAAPQPERRTVASAAPVAANAHIVPAAATAAPRTLVSAAAINNLPPGTQPFSGVVMQTVPVDPLAGPVKKAAGASPAKAAAKPGKGRSVAYLWPVKITPARLTAKPALRAVAGETPQAPKATKTAIAKTDTVKAAVVKTETVKTEAVKTGAVKMGAAKTPAPITAAAVAAPVRRAAGKISGPVKAAAAVTLPVKAAAVAPANPAAGKPPAPMAVAAKQSGVPALRLAADASTP